MWYKEKLNKQDGHTKSSKQTIQNGTEWNVEWHGMLRIRGQDASSLHCTLTVYSNVSIQL